MFRRRVCAALLVWTLGLSGLVAVAGPIDDIVAGVSQASYTSYLNDSLYTHTGDNRGLAGAEHDLARTNVYNGFASFGLTTSLEAFTYSSSTYYNVVGVKPGANPSSGTYIVGAHYDSVNNPGADDNASGVAGVLEAARVLSQYTFASTLVFIAFDREEQGLHGSNAYATTHAGDDIDGMLSLDMIAYNPAGADHNTALIYGRIASDSIKQALADAIALYGGGVTSSIQGQLDASDHAPFEWRGFQACLLIEGAVSSNPYYHQLTDNVDMSGYIDYLYATNMTRAATGYLATAADLVQGDVQIPEPNCTLFLAALVLAKFTRRRRRARSARPAA